MKDRLHALISTMEENAGVDERISKKAEGMGEKTRAGYMRGSAETARYYANKLRAIVNGKDPEAQIKKLVHDALTKEEDA